MSRGQVVRHSPLHSNKKGTVINRHLDFPRIMKPYTNGISILEVGDQPCVFSHGRGNER